MTVFVLNHRMGRVDAIDYGDIADLAQFYRELDNLHEEWYEDEEDAMSALLENEISSCVSASNK